MSMVTTTVHLEHDELVRARELGLNISATCRDAIRKAIEALDKEATIDKQSIEIEQLKAKAEKVEKNRELRIERISAISRIPELNDLKKEQILDSEFMAKHIREMWDKYEDVRGWLSVRDLRKYYVEQKGMIL